MNRDRLIRWLYPTIGFLFLAFSCYILTQELSHYNLEDILVSFAQISDRQIFSALGFTVLSYLAISTYDLAAFHQLNYYLKLKRILFTTFVAYAISTTTGFTLVIGGGIRYRFYSFWGIPTKTIAKIIGLNNLAFWLGLFTLGGISCVIHPFPLPSPFNLSILIIRCLGIIALILVSIYLYFCCRRKTLKIRQKTIYFPKITTSIAQITIFTSDLAFSAAVLYCLIPDYADKSYISFLGMYLFGMTASIMSNVPGGIGVFETIILFLLPETIAASDIIGSLLAYRVIRFLIPLAIALLFIFCFELKRRFNPCARTKKKRTRNKK